MFKNTGSDSAYVPSKSIAIKPDVVSDVIPDEISRALIPSYIAFADPRETYIKFNLSMSGSYWVCPVCWNDSPTEGSRCSCSIP